METSMACDGFFFVPEIECYMPDQHTPIEASPKGRRNSFPGFSSDPSSGESRRSSLFWMPWKPQDECRKSSVNQSTLDRKQEILSRLPPEEHWRADPMMPNLAPMAETELFSSSNLNTDPSRRRPSIPVAENQLYGVQTNRSAETNCRRSSISASENQNNFPPANSTFAVHQHQPSISAAENQGLVVTGSDSGPSISDAQIRYVVTSRDLTMRGTSTCDSNPYHRRPSFSGAENQGFVTSSHPNILPSQFSTVAPDNQSHGHFLQVSEAPFVSTHSATAPSQPFCQGSVPQTDLTSASKPLPPQPQIATINSEPLNFDSLSLVAAPDGAETSRPAASTNRKAKGAPKQRCRTNKKPQYWSADEHERFLAGLEKFGLQDGLGPGGAELMSMYMGNRSVLQIKSHAQKYWSDQAAGRVTCPR